MNWQELKKKYTDHHLSKPLKAPKVRLNALENIEQMLSTHFPDIYSKPQNLLNHSKNKFKEMLSKHKHNGRLNGAEESVINGLYKFLQ